MNPSDKGTTINSEGSDVVRSVLELYLVCSPESLCETSRLLAKRMGKRIATYNIQFNGCWSSPSLPEKMALHLITKELNIPKEQLKTADALNHMTGVKLNGQLRKWTEQDLIPPLPARVPNESLEAWKLPHEKQKHPKKVAIRTIERAHLIVCKAEVLSHFLDTVTQGVGGTRPSYPVIEIGTLCQILYSSDGHQWSVRRVNERP